MEGTGWLEQLPNQQFPSTHQAEIILASQWADHSDGHKALGSLYERYYQPLLVFTQISSRKLFLDSKLTPPDNVQGFFTSQVIGRGFLKKFKPNGNEKFRSFLMASVLNYMHSEKRRLKTKKRGGSCAHYSIDFVTESELPVLEKNFSPTELTTVDVEWYANIFHLALQRLDSESKKVTEKRRFQTFVTGILKPMLGLGPELNCTDLGPIIGSKDPKQVSADRNAAIQSFQYNILKEIESYCSSEIEKQEEGKQMELIIENHFDQFSLALTRNISPQFIS